MLPWFSVRESYKGVICGIKGVVQVLGSIWGVMEY